MRLLLALLCLGATLPVWGAEGTTGVDVWYSRPFADCANNGDGLAYGCAASAGASGAFRGLVNLIWTVDAGIDDGDTLYLCGHFKAADKRNATTMLDVVATAASEAARVTINGDCSAAGGPTQATIDAETATSTNILVTTGTPDPDYITIKNVILTGQDPAGAGVCIGMGAGIGIRFEDSTIYCTTTGITVTGTSFVIDEITMVGATVTSDAVSVGLAAVSGTISNSTLRSNATANNSDVIDVLGDNITALTVSGNTLYKGTGDKSALTIKAGSGVIAVTDNEFDGQTDESYGIRIESPFAGTLKVERNWFHNFGATLGNEIQLDAADVAATASIIGNVFEDGASQIASSDNWTVTHYNNTHSAWGVYGLYSAGTEGAGPDSLDTRNNAYSGTQRFVNSLGFEDAITMNYNAYSGGGDFRVDGTVRADLAAVVANSTYEDNGISDAPQFAGGAEPSTPNGFRLAADSPLIHAGINVGAYRSYGGRYFARPPSIGAHEVDGRLAAATRISAATRPAASARIAAASRPAAGQ